MTTTMLGGLATVCAEATPLNASGSARAVVIRSFLNIDVSFSEFRANQLGGKRSHRKNRATGDRAARSGENARWISGVEISAALAWCAALPERVRNFGVSSEISEGVPRCSTQPFRSPDSLSRCFERQFPAGAIRIACWRASCEDDAESALSIVETTTERTEP